jgi:hypothetical protein
MPGHARRLASRCHALARQGLDPEDAERITFEEILADTPHDVDLATLYEAFLDAHAPGQRHAYGVYSTPPAVIRAQVRLTADVLQAHLHIARGFADGRVLVVDPATGSGAYPLAVQSHVGQGSSVRMRLFEPMIGAATIARARGLSVEQRDALALRIDCDAAVVVCLGNPPYRRGRAALDQAEQVRHLAVGTAGLHTKNLYNTYVYFWRWALREVFERCLGPGVVCFITAASYLRGPAFGGLRQALRCTLDELWVIDLEGDRLAARRTDNVFPIRTPVAIALGVRRGAPRPSEPAVVHYARLLGSREHKLAALDGLGRLADLAWREAPTDWEAALVAPRDSRYTTWPRLTDLFPYQLSGAQLKRTWPIGPTPAILRERWAKLVSTESPADRAAALGETRDRGIDSAPTDLRNEGRRLTPLRALRADEPCPEPVRYAYRSFDRQWVLPDARLGDFMRPWLWRRAGPRQVYLTSLLTNVLGAGPAVVATSLVPDLDHFRGSFGARAVIPLWLDACATAPNIARGCLGVLAERYGFTPRPADLFAYCYALLAPRAYVARFEDELRTPGPHVPVTCDGRLFSHAAALGHELLRLHTYQRVVPGTTVCVAEINGEYPREYSFSPADCRLVVGNGALAPLALDVWAYSVSGMQVVPAWLRRRLRPRKGRSPLDAVLPREWTPSLTRELLELIWLLEATLTLEPALEALLAQITASECFEERASDSGSECRR